MRNVEIVPGEYFHIYNRAVEGQTIFKKDADYQRFCALLFFSNLKGVKLPCHFGRYSRPTLSVGQKAEVHALDRHVERHVAVCVYSIMPNHFHIKLMPNSRVGCEKFLQKFQMSYSKYFNESNGRKGRLFQGSYEAVHVQSDAQWSHLTNYIHGNPLDLCAPEWRDGSLKDWDKAERFLLRYRWSSLLASLGYMEQYPIVDDEYVKNRVSEGADYLQELKEWCQRGVLNHDVPGGQFK